MPYDRGYIHFVHNIYLAFFPCCLRGTSDNDSVYQLIAHLAGKFRRFEILFMFRIKSSALCIVFSVSVSFASNSSISISSFFCSSEYFCMKPIQISSGILPFSLSSYASCIRRDNSSARLRLICNSFFADFIALSASSALWRIKSSRIVFSSSTIRCAISRISSRTIDSILLPV